MSLNGVGVVLTAHAFSWPVTDVTMYVASPEIAITEAIITTDNRTDFCAFTEIGSNGFEGNNGRPAPGFNAE